MKLGLRKIQKFTCYIGYTFVHLLYRLHLCAPRKNPFQSYPFLTLFAGLGTDILHLTSLGLRKIQKFTCYIGYIFVHLLYGLHLCAPRKNPFQSYPFLTLFAGLGTDILHLCAPNRATSLCTAAEIWVLTTLCTK